VLTQTVGRPVVDRHADNRTIQQPAPLEAVQGPEGHHLGEIAGDPERDEDVRPRVGLDHVCAACRLIARSDCHLISLVRRPPGAGRVNLDRVDAKLRSDRPSVIARFG
jgi:hypothetical protein